MNLRTHVTWFMAEYFEVMTFHHNITIPSYKKPYYIERAYALAQTVTFTPQNFTDQFSNILDKNIANISANIDSTLVFYKSWWYSMIPYFVTPLVLSVLSLITNAVEMRVFFSPKMRSRSSLMLGVISLCCCITALAGILNAVQIVSLYWFHFSFDMRYQFYMRAVGGFVSGVGEFSAGYLVAWLSTERWLTVTNPHYSTKARAAVMLACVGSLSISLALVDSLELIVEAGPVPRLASQLLPNYALAKNITRLTLFDLPVTLAVFLTASHTVYHLRLHARITRRATTKQSIRGVKIATKVIIISSVLFTVLSILPKALWSFVTVLELAGHISPPGPVWNNVRVIIYFAGSTNPDSLVYLVFSKQYRDSFIRLFCRRARIGNAVAPGNQRDKSTIKTSATLMTRTSNR